METIGKSFSIDWSDSRDEFIGLTFIIKIDLPQEQDCLTTKSELAVKF